MDSVIAIGTQDFEKLRTTGAFYVDKTDFLREWWEKADDVTLITRPRRFGKTLNLSMTECFFSNQYAGRSDLFQGLSIWKEEKYRALQGTYPVLFVSFADIKAVTYEDAREGLIAVLQNVYQRHAYLLQGDTMNETEKRDFPTLGQYIAPDSDPKKKITNTTIAWALKTLMSYLARYYGRKVILLLDEYDTPLQEAYVNQYWPQLTALVRSMFNSTFKTNEYLYRALMTGITRVSRESIFSDLNNPMLITTTSDEYCTAFGFTEEEVFRALEERGMGAERETVRFWYDGFCFGSRSDIYNPWSITMFLRTKEYAPYWADSSSNRLVSELIRQGTPELKMQMEDLLSGGSLDVTLNEQVVFEQLKLTRDAIWSLLVASGYLKPVTRKWDSASGRYAYALKITNHEVEMMFDNMISGWFPADDTAYHNFKEALLMGDVDYMNQFLNEVSEEMFSSFDTGRKPSQKAHPERFYHGFVLGLIVDLGNRYLIRSNRQSGLGRYDVMMEPKNASDHAIIMEFKVFSAPKDKTLEGAVENALLQIETKKYDAELIARGIPKERIRHYGFAFDGQRVLIGEAEALADD